MLTIAILALLCLVVGGILAWTELGVVSREMARDARERLVWGKVGRPPEHISERDWRRVTSGFISSECTGTDSTGGDTWRWREITARPFYHWLVERTTQQDEQRQRQAVKAISEWRQR